MAANRFTEPDFYFVIEINVNQIVFSSSATVYGPDCPSPYIEHMQTNPTNAYGRTKWMVEHILSDLCQKADSPWSVILLRYFNPIGAHESGQIGEDPSGIPNNLMPYISQVAIGRHPHLRIFGNDYNTPDGTGVRDYIHVVDLAKGHVKALEKIRGAEPSLNPYNLGSGVGISVLDMVNAFEQANNISIPYEIYPRREGDIDSFFADASLALKELNWQTEKTLENMVRDTWRWQSQNPKGYKN